MSDTQESRLTLEPLPYHRGIRDFLVQQEPDVWEWFSTNRVQEQYSEKVRFELLKSTYRLEPTAAETLYRLGHTALDKLQLDIPLTLYQAQSSQSFNGSIALLPDEAHVVLYGDLKALLAEDEILALLGHELSHLLLFQQWDGEYLIVDQILSALSNDPAAERAHHESIRLFGLYTEIFCDRGSLVATEDPQAVIRTLVKTETGLKEVSAESYVRQAEEIFSQDQVRTDQLTHPEAFIRTRALQLWSQQGEAANEEVAAMIEGRPQLENLDLLAQRRISRLTERLIRVLLAPPWMRTEVTLNHARSYFDDFDPDGGIEILDRLAEEMRTDDEKLQDYYCYVLMDFATADRDLEEYPLAAALDIAERLKLLERFKPIAIKEMRLRKKQLDRIYKEREDLLRRVEQEGSVE